MRTKNKRPLVKSKVMWMVTARDNTFYVDSAFTRKDMIERHVAALGYDWKHHYANGDRCIKVFVTPI